jgi:butyrate kinase
MERLESKHSAILVINTGSTSTKCALYYLEGDTILLVTDESFSHPDSELKAFPDIPSQKAYREEFVRKFVDAALPGDTQLVASGAIGGMLPPVPSGVIVIDSELARYCLETPVYQHASNLAAPIAFDISHSLGIPAYAVDPVGVDEMNDIARISGSPLFPRFSFVHALNIRATAKKLAQVLGKSFGDLRIVACHLGGGFSIAPLAGGRIIDSDNRMEGAPFTPERAGGVPPIPLMEACFSGKWTKADLHRQLYGQGGLFAYLGTKDIRKVVSMIESGDNFAKFIYDAMVYQICKEIGAMASVLKFRLDGIILTGGAAREKYLASEIESRCSGLAKVYNFPGENENEAIAQSVAEVLAGSALALDWPGCILPVEKTDPLRAFGKSFNAEEKA